MALILTQFGRNDEGTDVGEIRGIRKEERKTGPTDDTPIQTYNRPKKTNMPYTEAKKCVLPLRVLVQQNITLRRARNVDFDFLKNVVLDSNTPEYGVYNTRKCRNEGHSLKPATSAMYTPLIDMVPSDPSTMMTAMVKAQQLTNRYGQAVTVFTNDQQLYRVVVDILWNSPE